MASFQYTTLISSLPHQPALFTEKQTEVSRIRLDQRLGMLEDDDRELLQVVEELVSWQHLDFEVSDEDIVRAARKKLAAIPEGLVRELVEWRLELRTAVAALRRRAAGEAAPGPQEIWGYGRWVDHIRRHWSDPDFRLSGVFPWLNEAARLLAAGDSVGLERLLLTEVGQHLARTSGEYEFDFEAVVIYVMRWNQIDRWSRYQAEAAAVRFDELLAEGLGDYADLFGQAAAVTLAPEAN